MHSVHRQGGAVVPEESLRRILDLYERGLYLQAYEVAKPHGPLHEWGGTSARILGGRLANNLGSRQIADWLHLRAWLADRTSPEAAYYCGTSILSRRGPLALWKFLQNLPEFPGSNPASHADLFTLKARAVATFRDFERAESFIARARELGGNSAWIACEESFIFESQDKYDPALAVVQAALASHPYFRPAIQQAAHLLQLLNRDQEAASLLRDALQHVESGACATQLSVILEELGEYREAITEWERVRTLLVLGFEDDTRAWHSRMADLCYFNREFDRAMEHARKTPEKSPHQKLADQLESSRDSLKRVHLPVGFVRQHYVTCAPATLSAVAAFLGRPVDHLALAREITYDGTPDHFERAWAAQSGFVAREFRVTREVAIALLDRGIPFTLVTTEIGNSHLQAVIGYDLLRDTFTIRDPYQRWHSEFSIEPLLKRYAAFGPRGMVLVPQEEAHRLGGIELPEAQLYDEFYRLRRALHVHDRAEAEAALASIQLLDPAHRLALTAQREIAAYDGNLTASLAAMDGLLALYPGNGALLMGRISLLRELSRRDEAQSALKELASSEEEPVFWRERAMDLSNDARQRGNARRLALRVLRHRPLDATNLTAFAGLLWDERRFAEACALFRLAASLRDTVETYSRSYFIASRHLRETDQAVAWLRECVRRHGTKSSQPARMLFWALDTLDRSEEAFTVLGEALVTRPQDGDLLLHAADAFARYARQERSDEVLDAAKSRSSRTAWLRTSAAIAGYRSDLAASLALWREVVQAEPLQLDAQRAVAHLVAQIEGRAAAVQGLEALVERFPHHIPLQYLRAEWARFDGAEEVIRTCRRALGQSPDDAWLHRELALALSSVSRFTEAIERADSAIDIEPQNCVSYATRGHILLEAGRLPEARDSLRDALRIFIDFPSALADLLAASPTAEDKREAAAFVHGEWVRQVVFGDGILAFREIYYTVVDRAEMLAWLREANAARPDLWHTWAALVRQLVDHHTLGEALDLATETTKRFPSIPGAWSDLALVCRLKGDRPGEIHALQRATLLNPSWTSASSQLALAHESVGEFDHSRRVLESSVARAPIDSEAHLALAGYLWRRGEHERALERIGLALRHDPSSAECWSHLHEWTSWLKQHDRAIALARELTASRPGEAQSWLRLAQMLPDSESEEALKALDRADGCDPRSIEIHDARATILAQNGRFDEALAACSPAVFEGNVPINLKGRAAWVEAVRGHTRAAVDQLKALLDKNPNYYWGWSMLAQWLVQLDQNKEALAAAEQLIRLAPRSPVPLGFLAEAHARSGNKKEAFEALRRAFDLDPSYEFAGFTLFDHQLESRDFAAAAKTLDRLKAHLAGARTDAAEIRLEVHRGEKDQAIAHLRKLCFSPARDAVFLRGAAEAAIGAGWSSPVSRLLSDLLHEEGVNPEVGALWVDRLVNSKSWGKRDQLYAIDPRSELGRRARWAFVGACGAGSKSRYLNKLVARERDTLRENIENWGQVGYAYVANGLWGDAARWMDDWRSRKDAQPWMLSNLALALRQMGRGQDAQAVNRHALTLHGDHTTSGHHVWAALERALEGNWDEVQSHLVHAKPGDTDPFEKAAYALTSAMVNVNTSTERSAAYAHERKVLRSSKLREIWNSPALKHESRHAVRIMAAAAGKRPFSLSGGLDSDSIQTFVIITVLLIVAVAAIAKYGFSSPPVRETKPYNFVPPTTFATPPPRATDRDLSSPGFAPLGTTPAFEAARLNPLQQQPPQPPPPPPQQQPQPKSTVTLPPELTIEPFPTSPDFKLEPPPPKKNP